MPPNQSIRDMGPSDLSEAVQPCHQSLLPSLSHLDGYLVAVALLIALFVLVHRVKMSQES